MTAFLTGSASTLLLIALFYRWVIRSSVVVEDDFHTETNSARETHDHA